jgi:hypothetical protein
LRQPGESHEAAARQRRPFELPRSAAAGRRPVSGRHQYSKSGPTRLLAAARSPRRPAGVHSGGSARIGFYDRWVLPSLLNAAMSRRQLRRYRRACVPQASGRVLEIGVGSGLNLPFYGAGVESVIVIDPSSRPLTRDVARRTIGAAVRRVYPQAGTS